MDQKAGVGSGRVFSGAGWNLLGQALPVLVALVTIPWLIRTLGLERFGFLTLAWALVGYASLFDFGIGRALTRSLAQRLAAGETVGARAVPGTAMVFLVGFGSLLGVLLFAASGWIAHSLLQLSPELREEAMHTLRMLALSMPFVMTSAGYIAILSAHQRFREINLVRIAMGFATFSAPLLVSLVWPRLDTVVAAIVVMRVIANLMYARLCASRCNYWLRFERPTAEVARELFQVGGWISVSNFISPMLTYLDRLALAALVPVKSVAFYTTPYDLLSRMQMVPYALTASAFPVAAGAPMQAPSSRRLLGSATRGIFVTMFPLILVCFCLADPLLSSWLGPEIAEGSSDALRILALGMFCNALAQAPAMMIQASGQPRSMALLHLAELPLFALAFWWLATRYGINGAAVAASLRLGVDAVAVFAIAMRSMHCGVTAPGQVLAWALLSALLLGGGLLQEGAAAAMLYTLAALLLFGALAWTRLMTPDERCRIGAAMRLRT